MLERAEAGHVTSHDESNSPRELRSIDEGGSQKMTKYAEPFLHIMPFENQFIMVSVLDQAQLDTLRETCSVSARIDMPDKRHLVLVLLTAQGLHQLYEQYEPRSRSWRGRYQALAKAIVQSTKDVQL
jgi:hypothetical protein